MTKIQFFNKKISISDFFASSDYFGLEGGIFNNLAPQDCSSSTWTSPSFSTLLYLTLLQPPPTLNLTLKLEKKFIKCKKKKLLEFARMIKILVIFVKMGSFLIFSGGADFSFGWSTVSPQSLPIHKMANSCWYENQIFSKGLTKV